MDLLFTLLWWWLVTLLVIYVLSFVFEPLQYVLYKQKLVFKVRLMWLFRVPGFRYSWCVA